MSATPAANDSSSRYARNQRGEGETPSNPLFPLVLKAPKKEWI